MPSPRRTFAAVLRPLRAIAGAFRTTRRTVAVVPDLVEAILVLPTLSRQLEVIGFSTATLPEMHKEIQALRRDTRALPEMDESLRQLVELAVPLQGAAVRIGRLSDRWPQRRDTMRLR